MKYYRAKEVVTGQERRLFLSIPLLYPRPHCLLTTFLHQILKLIPQPQVFEPTSHIAARMKDLSKVKIWPYYLPPLKILQCLLIDFRTKSVIFRTTYQVLTNLAITLYPQFQPLLPHTDFHGIFHHSLLFPSPCLGLSFAST